MNKNKKIDLPSFYFDDFKMEALSQLKSGQAITGKDGILTPLIKELLEAALEGEMDAHISTLRSVNTFYEETNQLH